MKIRIVRTKSEFEGTISEETALIEGTNIRSWGATDVLTMVNKGHIRIDN